MRFRTARGRAYIAATLTIAVLSWATALYVLRLHVRTGPAQQSIGVKWMPGIDDLVRRAVERRLGLQAGEASDSGTWTYHLERHDRQALRRIVDEPLIADTSHIDRQAYRIAIDAPGVPGGVRRLLERDLGLPVALALALAGLGATWLIRPTVARSIAAVVAVPGFDLLLAVTALSIGFVFFVDNGQGVDENIHYDQIVRFARGDWSLNPTLTTIPGFHALVAAVLWTAGGPTESSARVVMFAISLATVFVFYALVRTDQPAHAGRRTLQFTLLPVLFPQFFLVYTDVASLLFVLAMMLATGRRRYGVAGALGLASCLIRQNNVIWVAFAMLWSHLRESGWTWRPLAESLTRYWTFVATGVAFIAFVVVNDGQVALGDDAASHPLGALHVTNVFFALFLSFFLFLPLGWGYRRQLEAGLGRAWPWLSVAGLFIVFWFAFINDHPHNNERADFFLPNALLIYFSSTALTRLAFFVPAGIAWLGAMTMPIRRPWWLLYPFTVLFLLPEWLVVPRYYLIPWSLFLVAREPASAWTERVQTLVFLAGSIGAYLIIERAWGWI